MASFQDGHKERAESNRLRLVLRSDLSELDRLHAEIERYGEEASLPHRDIQHCILAVEEVVTNIIRYGYPSYAEERELREREIVCVLTSDEQSILLTVTDDAIPYNPLDRNDPDVTLALEERVPGGLGVYFVKQVMDEVAYERIDGCNKLIMTKRRTDGGHYEHST
jgi:serine/threonine-protein kinase RsbW